METISYTLAITILIYFLSLSISSLSRVHKIREKQVSKFILITKSKLNNKGSVTFVSLCIAFVLSYLFYWILKKDHLETSEAKFRKETYICMAYLKKTSLQYIKDSGKINASIALLYASLPQSMSAYNLAKLSLKARHLLYINNILTSGKHSYYCNNFTVQNLLLNQPYQTNGLVLQTNFIGQSICKSRVSFVVSLKENFMRKSKVFKLISSIELASNLDINPQFKTIEI